MIWNPLSSSYLVNPVPHLLWNQSLLPIYPSQAFNPHHSSFHKTKPPPLPSPPQKMSKPTIVLVPGAWHKPEIYDFVTQNLEAHDYPTISLALPSAGAMPPNLTFDEDVSAIRDCLTTLVESDEKEVILVVHSYTGMPGAEAPRGLGRKERQERGLNGGVIRLVFIMAFAMPEGFQPTAGGAQMPEWMQVDVGVS